MEIGVIVNPIAGMGGSVGLKGTDGQAVLAEALTHGAQPVAGARARRALAALASSCPGTRVAVGAGEFGRLHVRGLELDPVELGPGTAKGAEATRAIAMAMVERGIEMIAFAGGDGTARDVLSVVGCAVPILGIPCGVKMHSGVFAVSPEAAGRVLADVMAGSRKQITYPKVEIMDIDEAGLRAGRLNARLYGYARAPRIRHLLQYPKGASRTGDDAMLAALGKEIADEMVPGATYLIGPGTTAKQPEAALGIEGELLGVDVLRDRHLVARDVSARQALELANGTPLRIVVGVIGGQGFVFGRGNQQISAEAIRRCWPDGVTILAGAGKLSTLPQPHLLADTGDPILDAAMSGHVRVRTGPRRSVMMRIGHPGKATR